MSAAEDAALADRRRVVAWADPEPVVAAGRMLAGLELLRRIRDGELPPPPIGELLGFALTEVEEGRVVMRMRSGEYLYNPLGTVHGGALATLLDSVMGCAVHSTLPPGRGYTTLEIKVNYVRAATAAAGALTATGQVLHGGRRSAVAEGKIIDARGRLVATASTTCLVFDLESAAAPA